MALACTIVYPIKAHVDCFWPFFLDGVIGKAVSCGVVDFDWSGRLWVTTFEEQGADRDGLLAFDVSGSNFGSGSRTHHVGHDAGHGVNGTIETKTGGGHRWELPGNYPVFTVVMLI